MTTRTFGAALHALLLIVTGTSAQVELEQPPPTFGSLSGTTSPRAVALGMSLVARSGTIDAWRSNPATITGASPAGIHHAFGGHALEIARVRSDYSSTGIWLTIPAATFALHYTRDQIDDFSLGGDERARSNDRTIAISIASSLPGSLSLGVSVKHLRDVTEIRDPALSDDPTILIRSNTYVDMGALFSMAGIMDGTGRRDSIHFGLSLLDIGGEIAWEGAPEGESVAQWLRIGGAYDIVSTKETGPDFRTSLTAQYSRVLNSDSPLDYGAIGLEAAVNELISVRVGMHLHPSIDLNAPLRTMRLHPSHSPSAIGVFGRGKIETTPWYSFGIGVDLPLRKIGIDLPLAIGVDYAHPGRRDAGYESPTLYNVFEIRASYIDAILGGDTE